MLDVRRFKDLCHRVARTTRGSVVEFRLSEGVTPNFHQGVLAYGDRTVAVVCDRERPLIAVAEPVSECGPLTFLDEPELTSALRDDPTFRVLAKPVLDAAFDHAEWPHLSAHDVTYWRPGTVGEALFNHWD